MFFTDPTDFAQALDTSDTLTILATAVDASVPTLTLETHTLPTHTALVIQDADAPLRTRTTIQLLITPATGAFTIQGAALNGVRWNSALQALAAETNSSWEWQPADPAHPGHFNATLSPSGCGSPYTATTDIQRADHTPPGREHLPHPHPGQPSRVCPHLAGRRPVLPSPPHRQPHPHPTAHRGARPGPRHPGQRSRRPVRLRRPRPAPLRPVYVPAGRSLFPAQPGTHR